MTYRRVLHWPVVGRVWAMDFAEPSLRGQSGVLPPLGGRYPYLLVVRDLASGYQLCWLPVLAATSAITCATLARLFAAHGMPLVLKADNGPPFRADQTKRFLQQAGVHFLFSPPHWPGYNGAIHVRSHNGPYISGRRSATRSISYWPGIFTMCFCLATLGSMVA